MVFSVSAFECLLYQCGDIPFAHFRAFPNVSFVTLTTALSVLGPVSITLVVP